MSVLSWLAPKANKSKIETQKRELKAELASTVVEFERRRTDVAQVADDVMKVMHRRRRGNDENA